MKFQNLFNQQKILKALLIVLTMLTIACEDNETILMRLLVYDKTIDTYAFENVEVTTLNDINKLDGDATIIESGMAMVLDYSTGRINKKENPHKVAFSAVKSDGVLIPDSFHSLSMASIYYNMELSYLFFRNTLGLDNNMPVRLPTYYSPRIVVIEPNGTRYVMKDNAFYAKISSNERGFFIVPFEQFQWIPISLNTGIITHEYTHYIVDKLLLDNIPDLDVSSENFLLAFNEAVADYMAVARTTDPDYMAPSIPTNMFVSPSCNEKNNIEISRDISRPISKFYTESMDNWARNSDNYDFCPYDIGLTTAGIFYQIALKISEQDKTTKMDSENERMHSALIQVASYVLKSLSNLSKIIVDEDNFELWYMFSAFIEGINNNLHSSIACDVIEERYSLFFSEVVGC